MATVVLWRQGPRFKGQDKTGVGMVMGEVDTGKAMVEMVDVALESEGVVKWLDRTWEHGKWR